jgi:hypothetical protein
MSEFETVIARIEALPNAGEGMSIGEISARVESDDGTVVAALETIVERERSQHEGEKS